MQYRTVLPALSRYKAFILDIELTTFKTIVKQSRLPCHDLPVVSTHWWLRSVGNMLSNMAACGVKKNDIL